MTVSDVICSISIWSLFQRERERERKRERERERERGECVYWRCVKTQADHWHLYLPPQNMITLLSFRTFIS